RVPAVASKAGIIIGIHNIFIVIPQFVMTGIASLIFLFLDPSKSASPHSGVAEALPPLAGNGTEPVAGAVPRAESTGGGPNSYAVIYRLGGLSAAVAFVLTLRLARELKHH
ncbi:hypothetical protein FKP32DRAFT_1670677, partial [Trametes sanguinea]